MVHHTSPPTRICKSVIRSIPTYTDKGGTVMTKTKEMIETTEIYIFPKITQE